MDMTEHWEQRANILDGLSAALAYMEDQIENLKSLIEDEVEQDRTEYAQLLRVLGHRNHLGDTTP